MGEINVAVHATWVSHVLNRYSVLDPTMRDECTHVVSTLRCVGALTALWTCRDKMGTKRGSREAKRNTKREADLCKQRARVEAKVFCLSVCCREP